MTPEVLLSLYDAPPTLGRDASVHRDRLVGRRIRVRAVDVHPIPTVAARARNDGFEALDHWPEGAEIEAADRLLVQVDPTADGRMRFARWLQAVASRDGSWSLAPFCRQPAGLHRLWCIAVARLSLPGAVHIEARHDLIGIRLAQIALGFGADTLSGPLESDRKLPLAGVTRPNEVSRAGIHTLIRQAGLEPADAPPA